MFFDFSLVDVDVGFGKFFYGLVDGGYFGIGRV